MNYSRRDFGKLALASLPAAALLGHRKYYLRRRSRPLNPTQFGGVQIGTITYSYRSMPDQSAEAILKYVVDSGINAIELMGPPVEAYAQKRTGFTPPGGGGRGAGRALVVREAPQLPACRRVRGTVSRVRLFVRRWCRWRWARRGDPRTTGSG